MDQSAEDLVGKPIRWEASGRGRGRNITGIAVAHVEPGTTNAEAIECLKKRMPDLRVRRRYLRFDLSTYSTRRVLALVAVQLKIRTVYHIYAPNAVEVAPVEQ